MTFRDLSGALRIVIGAFVGIVAYANFGPQPEPLYREVKVSAPQIEYVERVDTVVTWKERIVYKTVKAEQVATAEGGAEPDVASFCADAVRTAIASVQQDTANEAQPIAPQLLLRSVRVTDPWFFGRSQLIVTGPLSSGDLRQMSYRVRDGFQARVHGDSLIVQYPRSALLKDVAGAGVWVGLGYLIAEVF